MLPDAPDDFIKAFWSEKLLFFLMNGLLVLSAENSGGWVGLEKL
jgi:hypothetical protein